MAHEAAKVIFKNGHSRSNCKTKTYYASGEPDAQLVFCEEHNAAEIVCNWCSFRWLHKDSKNMMMCFNHGVDRGLSHARSAIIGLHAKGRS